MSWACTRARGVLISFHKAPGELHVRAWLLHRQLYNSSDTGTGLEGCPAAQCTDLSTWTGVHNAKLLLFTPLFIEAQSLTRTSTFAYLCLPEGKEGIDSLLLSPSDISNPAQSSLNLITFRSLPKIRVNIKKKFLCQSSSTNMNPSISSATCWVLDPVTGLC